MEQKMTMPRSKQLSYEEERARILNSMLRLATDKHSFLVQLTNFIDRTMQDEEEIKVDNVFPESKPRYRQLLIDSVKWLNINTPLKEWHVTLSEDETTFKKYDDTGWIKPVVNPEVNIRK